MDFEPALVREVNRILAAIREKKGGGGGGAGADDKARRAKGQEITATERFRQAVGAAQQNVLNFAQALLPIPTTLGQLVRQSVAAASPGAMSTLQKSWQLVMMQIGRLFIPAILSAAKALQEFAETLKTKVIPGTRALWDFLRGKGSDDIVQSQQGVRGVGMDARARAQAQFEKQYGKDEGRRRFKEEEEAAFKRTGAKSMEDLWSRILAQAGPVAGKNPVERWMAQMRRVSGIAGQTPGSAARDRAGGAGGGGGRGLLHDIRPPGYQAQYLGAEEARRQLQTKALQMTPLDVKLMQEEVEIMREILAELQKQRGDTLPPRAGR